MSNPGLGVDRRMPPGFGGVTSFGGSHAASVVPPFHTHAAAAAAAASPPVGSPQQTNTRGNTTFEHAWPDAPSSFTQANGIGVGVSSLSGLSSSYSTHHAHPSGAPVAGANRTNQNQNQEWRNTTTTTMTRHEDTMFDRTTSDISDWLRRQLPPSSVGSVDPSSWSSSPPSAHYGSSSSGSSSADPITIAHSQQSHHSHSHINDNTTIHQHHRTLSNDIHSMSHSSHLSHDGLDSSYLNSSQRSTSLENPHEDPAAYDHLFEDTPTSANTHATSASTNASSSAATAFMEHATRFAAAPIPSGQRAFSASALPPSNSYRTQLGVGDEFGGGLFNSHLGSNSSRPDSLGRLDAWSVHPSSSPPNSSGINHPHPSLSILTSAAASPVASNGANSSENELSAPVASPFNVHATPFNPTNGGVGAAASPELRTSPILEWGGGSSESDAFDEDGEEDNYPSSSFGRTGGSVPLGAVPGVRYSNPSSRPIAGGYHASPGQNIRRLAEHFLSGVDEEEEISVGGVPGLNASRAPGLNLHHRSNSHTGIVTHQSNNNNGAHHTSGAANIRYDAPPSDDVTNRSRHQHQQHHAAAHSQQHHQHQHHTSHHGQHQHHQHQHQHQQTQHQQHSHPSHHQPQQQQAGHQQYGPPSSSPHSTSPSSNNHSLSNLPAHFQHLLTSSGNVGSGGGGGGMSSLSVPSPNPPSSLQRHLAAKGRDNGITITIHGNNGSLSSSPQSSGRVMSPISPGSGVGSGMLAPKSNSGSVFRTSPLLDPSGYEYDATKEERMLSLDEVVFEDALLPTSPKTPDGSILDLLDEKGSFEKVTPPTTPNAANNNATNMANTTMPPLGSTLLKPIPVTTPQNNVNSAGGDTDASTSSPAAGTSSSPSASDSASDSTPPADARRVTFSASPSSFEPARREEDSRAFNLLHNQLVAFTKQMHTLQEQTLRLREELACRTRWAVRSVWPSAIVSVVGSVCAGVALPKSDLDFVVYFDAANQESARLKYLSQMSERVAEDRNRVELHGNDESGVQMRLTANTANSFPPFAHAGSLIKLIGGRKKSKLLFRSTKIQVFKDINLIRLRDGCSGVSVDLWFPLAVDIHKRSQQHTSLIHSYMNDFPAFYPLSCVVKTFMQQNLLNSGYSGLGSYGILLMIVRFLQFHRSECLRDRKPEEGNLGRLLCAFFRFYILFDYENLGVDVREDGSFFDKTALNDLIREQQLRELGLLRAEAEKRGAPIAQTKSVTATMNAATMSAAVSGAVRPLSSPRRLEVTDIDVSGSGSAGLDSSPSPSPTMQHRRTRSAAAGVTRLGVGDDDDDSGGEGGPGGVGVGGAVDLDDPALLSHFTLVIQDPQDPANSIICHHKALRNMIHAFSKAVALLDPYGPTVEIPQQAHWPTLPPMPSPGGANEPLTATPTNPTEKPHRPTTPGGTERGEPIPQVTLPLALSHGRTSSGVGVSSPSSSTTSISVPPLSRFHSLIDVVAAAQGPSQKPCPSSACKRAGPGGGPTMCPTQNKVCFTCGYMFVKPGVSTKHSNNAAGGGNSSSNADGGGGRSSGGSFHHRQHSGAGRNGSSHSSGVSNASNGGPVSSPSHLSPPGAAQLAAVMAQQIRIQNKRNEAGANSVNNNANQSTAGFNAAQLLNFVTMQQRHILSQQGGGSAARASEIATLQQSVNMLVNAVAAAGQTQTGGGGVQTQTHHSPGNHHHRRTGSRHKDDALLGAMAPTQNTSGSSPGGGVHAPLVGGSPFHSSSVPLLSMPLSISLGGGTSVGVSGGSVNTPLGGTSSQGSTPQPRNGGNKSNGRRGGGRHPQQQQQQQQQQGHANYPTSGVNNGGGSPYASNVTSQPALLSRPGQSPQSVVNSNLGVMASPSPNSYPILTQPASNHRSYSAQGTFNANGGNNSNNAASNGPLLYANNPSNNMGSGTPNSQPQQQQAIGKTSILGSPYATNGPLLSNNVNKIMPGSYGGNGGGRPNYSYPTSGGVQPQQSQQPPLIAQSGVQSSYGIPQSQSHSQPPFTAKQAQHLFQQHPLNLLAVDQHSHSHQHSQSASVSPNGAAYHTGQNQKFKATHHQYRGSKTPY